MATCARCGADDASYSEINVAQDYRYCDDCQEKFQQVWDEGVVVRSRHTNRGFEKYPYEVSVRTDQENQDDWRDEDIPQNQVEALGEGKKAMEVYDLEGLFLYQKTGSIWLIDEYLEVHQSIKEAVNEYVDSSRFPYGHSSRF